MLIVKWITAAGYPAAIYDCEGRHLCGYVGMGRNHPLYGKDYSAHVPELSAMHKKAMAGTIGRRSSLAVLCATADNCSMDIALDAHGGITYSRRGGQFPVPDSNHLWWVGFDCGHCDDTKEICTEAYVAAECELLAEQLLQVVGWDSPDK